MKRYIYIIILTLFLTILLFVVKNVFFTQEDKTFIENKYMEGSLIDSNTLYEKEVSKIAVKQAEKPQIDYKKLKEKILKDKRKREELHLASKVYFEYIPDEYRKDSILYTKILSEIVRSDIFNNKIISLGIDMYRDIVDVRGRMKNAKVKIFGALKVDQGEFISLFIHEFSHYVDLYYFNKTISYDKSDKFYSISWRSTKILKQGQKSKDFVSGYAMTNKYEDFAESFTYYVLHNSDFLYKTKKSEALKKKFLFFRDDLFKNKEFFGVNFSKDKKVLNYYRDITKINIKEQNFLQYIKN